MLFHKDTSIEDKAQLCFALAKVHEDTGDTNKEFEFLKVGNELRGRCLGYSIEQDEELFRKVNEMSLKVTSLPRLKIDAPSEVIPIFIIGMPRSGTSLIEQILSSYSSVYGGGELEELPILTKSLRDREKAIDERRLQDVREKYLSKIVDRIDGHRFVTDKLPHNFLNLPVISKIFPKQKLYT